MKFFQNLDPFLLLPVCGFAGISIFIIASTDPTLLWSQVTFFLLGFFFLLIFSSINYQIWGRSSFMIYILSIFLLIIIFFMPAIRGAHRWINFHYFIIQPSEVLKPFFILTFSFFINKQTRIGFSPIVSRFFLLFPLLVLIFRQPDLGNVLVYLAIYLALEIINGLKLKYLLIIALFFIILMPVSWQLMADYQKQRLISFVNPYLDPVGAGYNAIQSMISIGSGGILGLGLGRGTQSRLLFLPEYQTDFIFSSIVESLGFIGGLLVIFLYLILLIKIIQVAFHSANRIGKIVAIGFFSQIFIQMFINIGMNLGILPITGITLPLISSGGSSIIGTCIGLGIVANIQSENKKTPLVIA